MKEIRGGDAVIDLSGMISIPFLKKSVFTGSYQGMRYLLRRDEKVTGEATEETPAVTETVLTAVIWPEPFNYIMTAEEKKKSREFPFTMEGIRSAVAWMNEEYGAGHY